MKVFRLLFLVIVLKGVAFAAPFLEDILKKDKTNSISFEDSKKFGVDKSVPYILVFDKELKVIKKYNSFNELLLTKLVKNLQQGLYENGTLPPEQRIDLWQKNRF
ncbi:hypothetical protein [Aliarcobacter butzleri]|uniref:hypothetical protein n=1 Tax=Aliarcobacter butzleri TaxID=28197 RepID=UPI002B24255D|nr:hypothetical protein [Aliarcobacter butzleri]